MAVEPSLALVTGGARGIGRAICLELARRGHRVIVNYVKSADAAARVCAEIEGAGGQAEPLGFDVRDAEATERAIAGLLERPEPVDVLVNNAGIAIDKPFPAMNFADWEAVTRTTLDGFYRVTQPLVMPMVQRRRGRIVNISSVSGVVGNRGQVNYSAAKAGLIGATKALAQELAKRKITVNAVAPGLVETDMIEGAPVDEIKKIIPMRRLGRPEEVAALVGFLVSDDAAYITGQVIGINGGLA